MGHFRHCDGVRLSVEQVFGQLTQYVKLDFMMLIGCEILGLVVSCGIFSFLPFLVILLPFFLCFFFFHD